MAAVWAGATAERAQAARGVERGGGAAGAGSCQAGTLSSLLKHAVRVWVAAAGGAAGACIWPARMSKLPPKKEKGLDISLAVV